MQAFLNELSDKLQDSVLSFSRVHGGDINQACKVLFKKKGLVFVKFNANAPKDLFEKEVKGLLHLRSAGTDLRIPKPDCLGRTPSGISYLIMEFIENQRFTNHAFEHFGTQLAMLHRNSSETFGLPYDNYIGSLPQSNQQCSRFSDFLWQSRIFPQLQLAVRNKRLDIQIRKKAEKAHSVWERLIPIEPPALIHGDLWSGNCFCDTEGKSGCWDPAIHYSHREMELAFTHLFGGFSSSFYDAYKEAFPLEHGFEERIRLYQLYPILVHVNLFGGSYSEQAKRIIEFYV